MPYVHEPCAGFGIGKVVIFKVSGDIYIGFLAAGVGDEGAAAASAEGDFLDSAALESGMPDAMHAGQFLELVQKFAFLHGFRQDADGTGALLRSLVLEREQVEGRFLVGMVCPQDVQYLPGFVQRVQALYLAFGFAVQLSNPPGERMRLAAGAEPAFSPAGV